MPTIISIGHQAFALARASDAAPIIRALADAKPLRHDYLGGQANYWPDNDLPQITIINVPADRILKRDPKEDRDRQIIKDAAARSRQCLGLASEVGS